MSTREALAKAAGTILTTLLAVLLTWLIWFCLNKFSAATGLGAGPHGGSGYK